MTEAKMLHEAIDREKLERLNGEMDKLKAAFSSLKSKMPETNKVLDDLDKKVNQTLSSFKSGAIDKLKSIFGQDVEGEILSAYKMIYNFKELWPQLAKRVENRPQDKALNTAQGPDEQKSVNEIRQLLLKAIKPSFSAVKKKVIDPETFVDEVMALTPDELNNLTNSIQPPKPEEVEPLPDDQGVSETEKTQETQPTQQSEPSQQSDVAVAKQSSSEIEKIAKKIAQDQKLDPETSGYFQSVLNTVTKAGYNIVPRD